VNIEIFSAKGAAKEVKRNPGMWHVISLRGPDQPDSEHPMYKHEQYCAAIVIRKFDDVWLDKHGQQGYILPSKEDVQACLDFVTEHSPANLLVHCAAGVSRSSATAYLVACTMKPASEAITMLNPMLHMPNERIVQYGTEILGNTDIWREFQKEFGDELFADLMGY